MRAIVFKFESGEGEESTQRQTCHLFFVFPQKVTSFYKGPFMVECWLGGATAAAAGLGALAALSLQAQLKAAPLLVAPL